MSEQENKSPTIVKMEMNRIGDEAEVTITRGGKEVMSFHANKLDDQFSRVGEIEKITITGYEIPEE